VVVGGGQVELPFSYLQKQYVRPFLTSKHEVKKEEKVIECWDSLPQVQLG